MSMILDALQKSDRQRARHVAERLREGPSVANAPGQGWRVMLAVAALLLAIALLLIAFRIGGGGTNAPAETSPIRTTTPIGASVRALGGELAPAPPATAQETATIPPPPVTEPPTRTEIADDLAAPPLAELPALRARLSSLHLDIHAWAEDPAERFVLINLRRYAEGDRLPEGPAVRRILRNGVVLEYEGTLFTLPRQ